MEEDDGMIICVIGDEDTVTGFLLAGVGQTDQNGSNVLVVDAKTTQETLEATFTKFVTRKDVGLVIINQNIANQIRPLIVDHTAMIPMILEIPSKDAPHDPSKDPIMKRVLQMLGEA